MKHEMAVHFWSCAPDNGKNKKKWGNGFRHSNSKAKLIEAYEFWERRPCIRRNYWHGDLQCLGRNADLVTEQITRIKYITSILRVALRGIVWVMHGSLVAMSDVSVTNNSKDRTGQSRTLILFPDEYASSNFGSVLYYADVCNQNISLE